MHAGSVFLEMHYFIVFFFLKEEFLDVIYWMRQLLSIVVGVTWGIFPLEGFVGMLL